MKRLAPLPPLLVPVLLAACTGQAPPPAAIATVAPRPAMTGDLDRVLGQDAKALAALFGPADQDARAMDARRLQFAGSACVLDAYLYRADGKGEPVVRWIDTRAPDGRDIDRASCIAALSRRQAAR